MALIQCPECGRPVSDKAVACPDCGYPISSSDKLPGQVAIKIGSLAMGNSMSASLARGTLKVQVIANGRVLAEGKSNSILRFSINSPTHIILKSIGKAYYEGIVKPKCKYELAMIPGFLMPRFVLNEVDFIDAGF